MQKKDKQLGMSFGKANHILKKMIMFSLIKESGRNICFQCEKPIDDYTQLSVEHKIPWLDGNTDLFWNIDNIGFSHLACNSRASRRPWKKVSPEGMLWCSKCNQHKEESKFPPSAKYLKKLCTECYSKYRREYRQKKKSMI